MSLASLFFKLQIFPRNVNLMNHNLRITLYLGPSTLLGHKNVIHFGKGAQERDDNWGEYIE